MPTSTAGPSPPPSSCDVLVVGAGPSGCACAQTMALAGLDVVLVDQRAFPRDKVCGDGLMPDALHALDRLGVLGEVMASACKVSHVGCIGPGGGRVDIPGNLAILPRLALDEILWKTAIAAGAKWIAPARFDGPLFDAQQRVAGARLRLPGGGLHELKAGWTVLATGAAPAALVSAGVCSKPRPDGMALRAYVTNAAMAARITRPEVMWHSALRGGYGWIFPCGDGVFNMGVGLANSRVTDRRSLRAAAAVPGNLRTTFEQFMRVHRPAAALMGGASSVGAMKGAPLRFGLTGARWSRPGLLVTGEAAGSTYSFTGEGIGKALETGMLAADAIRLGRDQGLTDDALRQVYESALRRLKPRFDLYEKARRINDHPWMANWLIRKANSSESMMRRLSGVLEETGNPAELVTAGGLLRMLLPLP